MTIHELDFRKIDLNLLVVFHALMQEQSVSRAAARLYLGPSAVSMSLRRLRELFGDELFIRSGASMVPSARAGELAPAIAQLLEGAHRLVYRSGAFNPNEVAHVFRLGASETCEAGVVSLLLAELRRLAPLASLVVRSIDATRVAGMLDTGDIELAVGYFRTTPAHQRCETLCHHDFVCLFHARQIGHLPAMTLETYLEHEHVLVSQRGDLTGAVDERLRELGLSRRVVACAARFSALPSWLTRSPLVATLPADIAQEMARTHGLETRPLPFDIEGYDIQMAWHRRLDEDKAAQWFRTLVQRVALETLPALREAVTD